MVLLFLGRFGLLPNNNKCRNVVRGGGGTLLGRLTSQHAPTHYLTTPMHQPPMLYQALKTRTIPSVRICGTEMLLFVSDPYPTQSHSLTTPCLIVAKTRALCHEVSAGMRHTIHPPSRACRKIGNDPLLKYSTTLRLRDLYEEAHAHLCRRVGT